MLFSWYLFLFSSVFNPEPFTEDRIFKLQEGTWVRLSSYEHSRELIGNIDNYVRNLSRFDLEGRLRGQKNATSEDYIGFAKNQVGVWNDEEAEKFKRLIKMVAGRIKEKKLVLSLPDTIDVVKSTCREEAGAIGYTRDNFMVMSGEFIYEDVFIHELFHIFSRINPGKRDELFKILGFKKCNPVEFPAEYLPNLMTNPDYPYNDYYITVKFNGMPIDVLMTIIAKSEYKGGNFFTYMDKRFMVLKDESGQKVLDIREGRPVMLKFSQVSALYEQIGRNTEFNIHPEEICAEHFIFLLMGKKELSDEHLITKMHDILRMN